VKVVPVSMSDRLLTVAETRERLQCARSTLYERFASGELRSVKLGEKSRRVRESDLDDYIASLRDDPPGGAA
jgi:excisionase family DNA binding protein